MIDDLKAKAAERRQMVVDKIHGAMARIEQEIKAHQGIYPHNKNVLNQAEVCRRAGVNPPVLAGQAHSDTTRSELNDWLDKVRGQIKPTREDARKDVTERADAWKKLYEDVQFQYHLDRLELLDAKHQLGEKDKRIAELENEVARMREQLSGGKITPIRKPPQPPQENA